jgi:hypothetical protein
MADALGIHLLSASLEIGEHFNSMATPRVSHQRRDCLDDLFVFFRLLFQTQIVTRYYLVAGFLEIRLGLVV